MSDTRLRSAQLKQHRKQVTVSQRLCLLLSTEGKSTYSIPPARRGSKGATPICLAAFPPPGGQVSTVKRIRFDLRGEGAARPARDLHGEAARRMRRLLARQDPARLVSPAQAERGGLGEARLRHAARGLGDREHAQ